MPRGGPSPAESIGGGLSKLAQAYLRSKLLKRQLDRQRKQDTRQDISYYIQQAQTDPSILQTPQAKTVFGKMGYPIPTMPEPLTIGSALSQDVSSGDGVPTGFENIQAVYGEPAQKFPSAVAKPKRDPLAGYGKPTISVGARGRVRGMTYRPRTQYPEGYQADITNAVVAIGQGADAYKVYQRIASQYPDQSTDLKRILLYTPASSRLEALREALFGGE